MTLYAPKWERKSSSPNAEATQEKPSKSVKPAQSETTASTTL